MSELTCDDIALDLIIEATKRCWQYNLSGYTRASLSRRVDKTCQQLGLTTKQALIPALLEDRTVFELLLSNLSVTVTEMFRDPQVYKSLRDEVLPRLSTYPFIRVWHAGCATGEEMYSLAILFDEAGLLERTTFVGTDINKKSLKTAQEGIYPLDSLKKYASLYRQAQCQGSFADYFHASYGQARMAEKLRNRMQFEVHDLNGDDVFGEFQLIMCRNVLIYFAKPLQKRALDIFNRSLVSNGFLCLGLREYLVEQQGWKDINKPLNIYQKHDQ
jgi:chemotaxis protein methyltransferase CheR